MSLKTVIVDLGDKEYQPGQSFVGLSRATSIEGTAVLDAISWQRLHGYHMLQLIATNPRLQQRKQFEARLFKKGH